MVYQKWPNKNIIHLPKNDRTQILILFGFPKMTKCEYKISGSICWALERRKINITVSLLHSVCGLWHELAGWLFLLDPFLRWQNHTKKWKFQFQFKHLISMWDIFADQRFWHLSLPCLIRSINVQQNMSSIRKRFPVVFRLRKYKFICVFIQKIFCLKKYLNKNKKNIRFEKITQKQIRIKFGFKKSPGYNYEY